VTQSRVNVTVTIEKANPNGRLTKADEWDIITACTVAARAAIEQYVAPSQRQNACDAVARVIRGPLPDAVKHGEAMVVSPFEEEQ
jgi:hypothetical protein